MKQIKRPLGTEDILPSDSPSWQKLERVLREAAENYGFGEIRTPTFEQTDLFERGVGETTDVVQKEMYTVTAKESTFTLRPEGTAGTIRALLQNGMLNEALPQRVYYILSCFRHERPQAGRLREFHQFGAEMVGTTSPRADAEVIALAKSILDMLGLKGIRLHINSIGCPMCRREYHKALMSHLEESRNCLCGTCQDRLEKNPMRILDCKSPECGEIVKGSPVILDYLCQECSEHFTELKGYLATLGIDYEIDPYIVRGLDYYTKTVFEFVSTEIGAQGTVCGGGRYDGLIGSLGGQQTPALGFGMGLERILLLCKAQGIKLADETICHAYIAPMGEKACDRAMAIAELCRREGLHVQTDVMGRSLRAQMKYADKLGARFTMVLGDNELEQGQAEFKNMTTGEKTVVALDEHIGSALAAGFYADMFGMDKT